MTRLRTHHNRRKARQRREREPNWARRLRNAYRKWAGMNPRVVIIDTLSVFNTDYDASPFTYDWARDTR